MTIAADAFDLIINIMKAVFGCLIDNDEKVTFSEKHSQFKTRVQNHTLFMSKMAKIDTLFLTKKLEK